MPQREEKGITSKFLSDFLVGITGLTERSDGCQRTCERLFGDFEES